MFARLLTFVARQLTDAPTDSRRGRLAAQLKAAVKNRNLDAVNVFEFEDVSTQERMLADRVRVDAYAAAIERNIGSDDTVVDLGTGTGILSFLAARRAQRVYAIDHSGILDLAKVIGEANGFTNIEFIKINSRDFVPPAPVDVLLHEQIGDELFEENMIENIVDLRERVLRPGGRILPARFELYLEPVMLLDDYQVPFIWQMNVHGVDFGCLTEEHLRGLPRRWDLRWQHRLEVHHALCDPTPIYELDLMTAQPGEMPRSFVSRRAVASAGRLDGFFVYFKVLFDEEVSFDTSPSTVTSWGNRLFRVPSVEVAQGDTVAFHVDVPDVRHVEQWKLTLDEPRVARSS